MVCFSRSHRRCATKLVSKEKESSAIALVFLGLTVALVTGVPLGTWIGQNFGWHATFYGVVLLALIGLGASAVLVPANLKSDAPPTLRQQAQALTSPRLLLVYLITAVGYGGNFIAFTYLAPMLTDITRLSEGAVTLVILLYGVSVAFGNILGGVLSDKIGPVPALTVVFAGLAGSLVLLGFGLTSPWAAVAVTLFWGGFAFGNVPPLQSYVVQIAREVSPGATDVASGMNIGAFNLGIAFGAWGGGYVVEQMGLQGRGSIWGAFRYYLNKIIHLWIIGRFPPPQHASPVAALFMPESPYMSARNQARVAATNACARMATVSADSPAL
ncbi:MFS transporter [Novosphingobium sp. 17-62-19]|uniref:MFS transporter n=1 Tax=Novosphingobium sp. 17-62-19 TaxID=1970406 RepID=UPI0025EDB617|nr:MFS transporter [Novosphingobium sp. 17-62-19]HQS96370.1 MFS transporter [Novosphingobium sp.]